MHPFCNKHCAEWWHCGACKDIGGWQWLEQNGSPFTKSNQPVHQESWSNKLVKSNHRWNVQVVSSPHLTMNITDSHSQAKIMSFMTLYIHTYIHSDWCQCQLHTVTASSLAAVKAVLPSNVQVHTSQEFKIQVQSQKNALFTLIFILFYFSILLFFSRTSSYPSTPIIATVHCQK